MNVSQITKSVYSALEEKGYRGRIVPIKYLAALKEAIEAGHNEGLFDEVFYQERLTHFKFSTPRRFPDVKSIIITSAPQPQQRVGFNLKGRLYHFIIPPTYSHKTDDIVNSTLSNILKPAGLGLYPAVVPLKLLAVHSGLAKYGKNNLAYMAGMGSFHRLKAFFSNLPIAEDSWFELQLLEQCKTCSACIKKCPTGAIIPQRFLVQAEKCLTSHNERRGEFPDWIEPSWHNCLIGCMYCQIVCPANKAFFNWFRESVNFTEEETELILETTSHHQLPQAAANKLKRIYLLEELDLISRNLKALVIQDSS